MPAQELARGVDDFSAIGHRHVVARADMFDPVAADDDDGVLDRRCAAAVDQGGAGDRDGAGAVDGGFAGGAGSEGDRECEGDREEPERNRMPARRPAHPVVEPRVRSNHSMNTSASAIPLSPATA